VTVVLATLMTLVAPMPAAAVVPGTNGLIAFVSSRDYHQVSGSDIYVMNADGTNPTRLTTDGSDQPVVSPDGKHIAYQCSRNGNSEICVMNADGSNPVNITNNPAADAEPAFSPDGTHIAFSSQGRDSQFSGSDIFVMNADGTNQTHLTTNRTGEHPVFSPDGKHIAFVSTRDGNSFEIYVMNADGSNPVNITNNPAYDAEPNWGVLAAQQTATTTALDVTPAPPVDAGTSQTLTATVTPAGTAGSVQFNDGTATIGNPMTVTNGTASMTTTLPSGTHPLTAVFTPTNTAAFNSSTSPVATYVVNAPTPTPSPPAPGITDTTTTLQVAPNPGFTFVPEILIARVSPLNAVGTVQFLDGTTPLGGPVPVFGGFAWLMTPLPTGTHSVTAMFIPTNIGGCSTTGGFNGSTPLPCPTSNVPAFAPSTSSPVSLTVQSVFGGLGMWVTSPHGGR
jgi:TolB protein